MVQLEANYSKKLGLPGFSSHAFSVTIKSELPDLSKVPEESSRLYTLLQRSVDKELQQTGFLPGQPTQPNNQRGKPDHWNCTTKQKDLILRMVEEHQINKDWLERLAKDRFGQGVKALNAIQASGLIDELIEKHPKKGARR